MDQAILVAYPFWGWGRFVSLGQPLQLGKMLYKQYVFPNPTTARVGSPLLFPRHGPALEGTAQQEVYGKGTRGNG